MDRGPPGSSVHGILLARILEWVDMPSSRGSSRSKDRTCVSYASCIGFLQAGFFSITIWEAQVAEDRVKEKDRFQEGLLPLFFFPLIPTQSNPHLCKLLDVFLEANHCISLGNHCLLIGHLRSQYLSEWL